MAKLKLLKLPKSPKLPKKPTATASLSAKENWLKRVSDLKASYAAKCREVQKENESRKKANAKSDQLTKQIANVKNIDSFKSKGR